MSDTSGVETPSRFMMGIPDANEPDDKEFEDAVDKFFGNNRPATDTGDPDIDGAQAEGSEQGQDGDEGEGQEGDEGQQQEGQEGSGQGTEGGDGEGQETDQGTQPPEPEADFITLFEATYQRKPTAAEINGLISLANWASSLTPEQQAAIDRALANPQGYQQPITPQPQPTPTPTPPVPDPILEEYGDDPQFAYLTTRMQAIQDSLDRLASSNVETQQAQLIRGLETGAQRFLTDRQVSEPELQALQGALSRSGLLPGFMQASGDASEAMYKGLDYLYWQTPSFRERELQRSIEARQAAEQEHSTRRRKASSVTGTGGNGASRTDAPPATPDQHWGAVVQGIREAMTNGQGQ